MDIATGVQKLRKYIASLSVVAMIAGQLMVPVASAATFSDVDSSNPFYTYIEDMVTAGVFEAKDNFYPDANTNRAEFAKATDVAAGIETTPGAVSGFSDMGNALWAEEWVEGLVAAGVVNGYSDAAGNPTNMFGPGDNVTRGQAARMIVGAFALADNVDCGHDEFPDVDADNIFHDDVMTMACWSIVNGYENGDFGVNDPITRGQMAKMLAGAQNPVEWTDGTVVTPPEEAVFNVVSATPTTLTAVDVKFGMEVDETTAGNVANYAIVDGAGAPLAVTAAVVNGDMVTLTTETQTAGTSYTLTVTGVTSGDGAPLEGDGMATFSGFTVVLEGSVTLELAQDTPAAGTHADATAYNNALKFNVTAAADSDVTLTSLVVKHGGISVDSTFSGVGVFDANGVRHGNFVTFADNKATINFPTEPIVVPAGTTASLWIKTNLAAVASASGTYFLSIEDAASVGATGTVSGSFPITGNTFTIVDGASTVGTVTVDAVVIHNNGTNDATAVNINLGTKDQDLGRFRFVAGSNEDIKVSKLTLYNNGNSNDGDVDNIRLVAPDGSILATVDKTVNRYAVFDLSASPYVITKGNTRDLTVRVDVVSGSTRTVRFLINNDYDIEVMGVQTGSGLLATAAGTVDSAFPMGDAMSGGASCTSSTTCINKITINSGTVLFAKSNTTPSGSVSVGGTNVELGKWDITAQGEDMEIRTVSYTLSSSLGAVAASQALTGTIKVKLDGNTVYSTSTLGTFGTAASNVTLSTFPTIKANVKSTMTISVDVLSTATAGTTLTASLDIENVKRLSTNDLVNASVSNTAGNTLTIAVPGLSVSKNSSYNDTTLVAGVSDGLIGSFTFTNTGTTEDITVSGVTLGLTVAGGGNLNNISNVYLKSGSSQLGSAITAPSTSNAISISSINGQPFKVAKGSSATVDVYATSNSSSSGTIVASITAVTATGSDSAVTVTATGVTATGQTITFATAGTLTVALDGTNTPSAQILHSAQVDATLLATTLQANNAEDIKVTIVQVTNTNGTSSLKDLKLFVNNVQVGNTVQDDKGTATFTNTTTGLFTVTKNTTVTMVVKGTTTTNSVINSNAFGAVSVSYIEALGVSGGVKIKPGTTLNTTHTATDTTTAGVSVTVGDTTGFHAGDVVMVYDGNSTGSLGMVTAEPSSGVAMSVATVTAVATPSSNTVHKISTGATVTGGTSGVLAIAGTVVTVATGSSTKAFTVGDPVIVNDGAGTQLGWVQALTSTTASAAGTLTVRVNAATNFTNGATTSPGVRVSKIGTDTLYTEVSSNTDLAVATGAAALTVTSSSGFNVGDVVIVHDTANGGALAMISAISGTTVTVIPNANLTIADSHAAGTVNMIRVGSANPSTTLISSAATGGARVNSTGSVAATGLSDSTGFGVGDVVMTIAGTGNNGGALLGKVTAVPSTTAVTYSQLAADSTTSTTSRITRLPGAPSSSKVFAFHDVEPTLSAKLLASDYGLSALTLSPAPDQIVGKFDVKADGDVALTFSSIDMLKNGSNAPEQYVTNLSLWNGSTQIAKVANTTVAGTNDDANSNGLNSDTNFEICAGATSGAVHEVGNITAAEAATLKIGDKITVVASGGADTDTSTVTITNITGTPASAIGNCDGNAANNRLITTDAAVTFDADDTLITIRNFRVHFDANQAQSGDQALAAQTVTAGSTMTLTVKASTDLVRTGVTQGTVTFGMSIPGTTGPVATNSGVSTTADGGFTWSYTPIIGGSAISSLAVSDNYPVTGPVFSY